MLAVVADPTPAVRMAGPGDLGTVGRLLHDFNQEFGEPTPAPEALAERVGRLLEAGDTTVLLVGEPPVGLALLRFRLAIFTPGLESYLAELYVAPGQRGKGLGRALMDGAMALARERGADSMEICVDEPDTVARRLYESLGFTNRVSGPDGPVMFYYERDLAAP